mmetsp:Transcript_3654/g.7775  ORF Transcript_3654/g.7775 Transcript_3654/m.7775 type:complete len:305 (-) Transcript_3654:481-1395(-)
MPRCYSGTQPAPCSHETSHSILLKTCPTPTHVKYTATTAASTVSTNRNRFALVRTGSFTKTHIRVRVQLYTFAPARDEVSHAIAIVGAINEAIDPESTECIIVEFALLVCIGICEPIMADAMCAAVGDAAIGGMGIGMAACCIVGAAGLCASAHAERSSKPSTPSVVAALSRLLEPLPCRAAACTPPGASSCSSGGEVKVWTALCAFAASCGCTSGTCRPLIWCCSVCASSAATPGGSCRSTRAFCSMSRRCGEQPRILSCVGIFCSGMLKLAGNCGENDAARLATLAVSCKGGAVSAAAGGRS